ncbi:RNA polymerase sigma-70 factor [Microlunatus endophyticus]|uniref:RNA polymerase sigma-70 factor n=1 Tax=Microlunatus endophyticus TaxID=1716077 RepID=UPI001E57BADF|nr:RNA polymerase sigma-70 factor [Microlunatus endophyticus]
MQEPATDATDSFVRHRKLLFTIAYEMLGSAGDAEDVLQETWLRWIGVDHATVRDHRAYLVRIATRQTLTQLRRLGRRKESYVGSWLPEPLLTSPDVAEDVELAESVSLAMLLVLETLSPIERAVFVLREVFDVGYDEIAATVDKSQDAVRQIAHRAREHVRSRRPRGTVSSAEADRALQAFRQAVETGRTDDLLQLIAPDVVMIGDGGGVRQAILHPLRGARRVTRLLTVGLAETTGQLTAESVWINGWPALILRTDGRIDTVLALRFDDGLITGLYGIRNPDKLGRLDRETAISR